MIFLIQLQKNSFGKGKIIHAHQECIFCED